MVRGQKQQGAVARRKAFLQRRFSLPALSPLLLGEATADVSNNGGGGPAFQSPKRVALWCALVSEDIERGG
jgi:hypothetical protein